MAELSNQPMRIGNFMGQRIQETITAASGTYVFDRIAEHVDGEFPLDQLHNDELLIRPGLIYRLKA